MRCSMVPPMLSRLLDGELLPQETAEVEGHVAQCEPCRALLENWRLQGVHLRSHLSRHVLGEAFVRKVVDAERVRGQRSVPARSHARGRGLMRWLPAAAAILTAFLIFSQLFPNRDAIGYARVIDPGERLEVLASNSFIWVRTAAGELLHPGDWLRNPVSAAEILWPNTCRLTLEPRTLVHIPDSPLTHELILLSGSLLSEVRSADRDFQVRTPAGSVSASAGRFKVRVSDVTLSNLQVAADRSEILTGTVMPAGEVSVADGSVKVEVANTTRSVSPGAAAAFAGFQLANTAGERAPVEASIKVAAKALEKGTLSSSLVAADEGLCVRIDAANISLKSLLECATGVRVRGGEDVTVAGTLRFPVNSSPESIASAVGNALDLRISFLQEKCRLPVALTQQDQPPALDSIKGAFKYEKTSSGLISFEFQAMPAGRAFQIVRSAVPDLPELSAEAEWLPITLRVSALNPEEVAAALKKALGLQLETADCLVAVIEIGNSAPAAPAGRIQAPVAPQIFAPRGGSAGGSQAADLDPGAGGMYLPSGVPASMTADPAHAFSSPAQGLVPVVRPLWSVLSGSRNAPGLDAAAASIGTNRTIVTGKESTKTRDFFDIGGGAAEPEPALHLIWPVLSLEDAAGAGSAYLVTNPMGLPAHTLWNAYNRGGQLVVQYAVLVAASSTLGLLLPGDLPTYVGEGGHWETLSDTPLVGSRDSGPGGGFDPGLPIDADRLRQGWSFPAAWVGELGGRLWVVNPGPEQAIVVVAVMRAGKAVGSEQLILPPHGGVLWPESSAGTPAGLASGAIVVVHSLRGCVAAGLAR